MNPSLPANPCDVRDRAHYRPYPATRNLGARGFTLIELMVVVIVIGLLVSIGLPAMSAQLKDRRTNQAAHEVSLMYRRARTMAMGRGTAVLVRFKDRTQGSLELREAANVGTTSSGTIVTLPSSSCQNPGWVDTNPDNRLIRWFAPAQSPNLSHITLQFYNAAGQIQTDADVCFTPLGRTFYRAGVGGTLATLTEVPYVTAARTDGVGLTRRVLVLPNGVARLNL